MLRAMEQLRAACALVAARAQHVQVVAEAIPAYASSLPPAASSAAHPVLGGPRERLVAFWLTLDAINFGSGWFPTLQKRAERSGYGTIASAIVERFEQRGPWSPEELMQIDAHAIAGVLAQDPNHELMALFARSLRDLGSHVTRFATVVDAAGRSAIALVEQLSGWECFADTSLYDGIALPFLKRAQLAAADLARAGVAEFDDLDQLTMFADNLVPHVLRLDGVLWFAPELVARIERGELIAHESREEIEIRACALHAVELIVAALRTGPGSTSAADIDTLLWDRGQQPRYKATPRHRSPCTAY